MSAGDRVDAMLRRVARTLHAAGIDDAEALDVRDLLAAALEHRRTILLDDEHFDTLHPARTILILLDDLHERDASALAAAVLVDTIRPELAPPPHVARAGASDDALAVAADVPQPDAEDLLERLVTADPRALRVALAERLDHARHLHLRDRTEWQEQHRLTCAVYSAVAEREGVLANRYEWWCAMFERELLGRD